MKNPSDARRDQAELLENFSRLNKGGANLSDLDLAEVLLRAAARDYAENEGKPDEEYWALRLLSASLHHAKEVLRKHGGGLF